MVTDTRFMVTPHDVPSTPMTFTRTGLEFMVAAVTPCWMDMLSKRQRLAS